MSVSLRDQKKSRSKYGKPDAVKVARPVWMRGKAQALPMHTFRRFRTERPCEVGSEVTCRLGDADFPCTPSLYWECRGCPRSRVNGRVGGGQLSHRPSPV